ncbi:hypothetical protein OKHIL_47680 [Mycolicibacterium mageritense]|nr:hypothetical protein MTY414_70690 [Mycolicibacterium mageritense]
MARGREGCVMPNSSRRVQACIYLALSFLAPSMGACGQKDADSGDLSAVTTATSATASTVIGEAQPKTILIEDFNYVVAPTVLPGAQITVTNKDASAHTVTADSIGAFDTAAQANSQVTFTAPTEPGAYPFHCTYHPNMHGQLVVVQIE